MAAKHSTTAKLQGCLDAVLRLQPKKQTLQLSESTLKSAVAQIRHCSKIGQDEKAAAWMYVIFAHLATSDEPVPEDCVQIAVHCATFGLHIACIVNERMVETHPTDEEDLTLLKRKTRFHHAWETLRGFIQASSRTLKQTTTKALPKHSSKTHNILQDERLTSCFGLFLGSVLALAHRASCSYSGNSESNQKRMCSRKRTSPPGIAEVILVLSTVVHECDQMQHDSAASHSNLYVPLVCLQAVSAAKQAAIQVLDEFTADDFTRALAKQNAVLKNASAQDRRIAREVKLRLQTDQTITVATLCSSSHGAKAELTSAFRRMIKYCGQRLMDERTQRWNPMYEPANGLYHVLENALQFQLRHLALSDGRQQQLLKQSATSLLGTQLNRTNKQLSLDARLQAAVVEAKYEMEMDKLTKPAQKQRFPFEPISPVSRPSPAKEGHLSSRLTNPTAGINMVEVVPTTCVVWSAREDHEACFLAIAGFDHRQLTCSSPDAPPMTSAQIYAQAILKQKQEKAEELEASQRCLQAKQFLEIKRHRRLHVAELRAQRDERRAMKAQSIAIKKQIKEQNATSAQLTARREARGAKELATRIEKELSRVRAIKSRKQLLEANERTLRQRREDAEAERRSKWRALQDINEQGSTYTDSFDDSEMLDHELDEQQQEFEERIQQTRAVADSFANRLNRGRFLYVNGKASYMDDVFPDPEPGYLFNPPPHAPGTGGFDSDDENEHHTNQGMGAW